MSRVPLIGVMIVLTAVGAAAQGTTGRRSGPGAWTGTYAFATTEMPGSGRDGCWLEAAPVRADSMHLQLLCRNPAPGHHLGVLDARASMRRNMAVYETGGSAGRCRITVRFAPNRARVEQHGTDRACGFGAFIDVSGTYVRLDARRPRLDLAPIEGR